MEVLKLYIHVNGCEKVESECATVQMISFDGRCDGDYFRGEILPGGVDTQIYYKDQPKKIIGSLSSAGNRSYGARMSDLYRK